MDGVHVMDIGLIFKIAAIGILVSILNQILKHSGREEMAMLTSITALVIVLLMVARQIGNLFNAIKTIFQF